MHCFCCWVGLSLIVDRYVVNLCSESPAPDLSRTQVEVAVRELRMYARKEAANELPGSRNVIIPFLSGSRLILSNF